MNSSRGDMKAPDSAKGLGLRGFQELPPLSSFLPSDLLFTSLGSIPDCLYCVCLLYSAQFRIWISRDPWAEGKLRKVFSGVGEAKTDSHLEPKGLIFAVPSP